MRNNMEDTDIFYIQGNKYFLKFLIYLDYFDLYYRLLDLLKQNLYFLIYLQLHKLI